MKTILALVTVFFITNAQASYMATHCSNSDTTVSWETGHNSNTLTMKFVDLDLKEVKVPYYDLEVKFTDEAILKNETIQNCGYASHTKVFAAKVLITPSTEKPDALDFLGENKKIETEVICTEYFSGRSSCP